RHARFGGSAADYEPAAQAFLAVAAELAGPSWNEHCQAAWRGLLQRVAHDMNDGAMRSSHRSVDDREDASGRPALPKTDPAQHIRKPFATTSAGAATRADRPAHTEP